MMQDELFFGSDFLTDEEDEVEKLSLREGELREVAVLFADIKGFTNISNLFEPEVIHGKMDDIMKIFSRCINFYGGFVDKYMGDGIMALFGAKKATEQDTQRCVLAAIKMQEQLRLYNKLLNREPGFEVVELGLRVGINTGLVSVGKVGESREGDFTVYGPQVNLASRMESNAPVNRIMMPKRTMEMVQNIFDFESYGLVSVKGMDEPIDCWLVLGQKSEVHTLPKAVFIGREPELELLEKEYDLAKDTIRVVGIKGDAGIGKSRLLQEFCKGKQDAMILRGSCSSISPAPFNLFTRILEDYFHIRRNSSSTQKKEQLIQGLNKLATNMKTSAEILDALPLIALLMEIKIPDPRVDQKGKDLLHHIQKAIETIIVAMAGKHQSQIIIILDDIHLVDDASAHMIGFLLDRFREQEINALILALYRLDYQILDAITSHEHFHEIEILPLAEEQVLELLKHYAGSKQLGDDTLKLVVDLSAGNPFYLEEWCNYISALPNAERDEYPVPGNLHALILSRLDNLPQNLRMILHKAAVIGNEFFVEILREVESRLNDPSNIENTLGMLEEHSLIMRLLGFDFSTYFFKHITTREVAYQTLLHQNRKLLHSLTAEAIENLFEGDLEDFVFALADHYVMAELPEKAIPYLQKAVDKAIKTYDNPLALKLGKSLLMYLDKEEKAEVLIKLADVLWLTGNWEEAAGYISEAETLVEPSGVLWCDIHRFLGVAAFYRGDYTEAKTQFDLGLKHAQKLQNTRHICIAFSNLGIWYQHHRDFDVAFKHHHDSLELAQGLSDMQRQAKTLSNLGLIYLELERLEDAYRAFELSLQISREHKYMRDESIALGNLGWACLHMDKLDEAREWLSLKLDMTTSMNDKLEMIKALGNLGNICFEEEDYACALSYYERSLALKEQFSSPEDIERSRNAVAICREKLESQT
ncbi:MAG: tetratricopeptide repeat protein [Candidatus Cloacimonetes bacterium]|nr:tetratricopeptide repeat protein [Candidatus Cloacimonadota bacterium]